MKPRDKAQPTAPRVPASDLTLGEQFRRRREKLKLSQAAAGAAASPPLMQKAISAIETGQGNPTLSTLTAYAEALGMRLRLGP